MRGESVDDLLDRVQAVFAEVTRYPAEVLDPAADLEDDLGIDSVKRAEILAVFRDRFGLSEKLEVAPEQLRTIATITEALRGLMDGSGAAARVPVVAAVLVAGASDALESGNGRVAVVSPPASGSVPAGWSRERVQDLVLDTMAEVTRYPRDVLALDADLEDDLGIDSVKLAEIAAVMRERLGLGDVKAEGRGTARTVGELIGAAHELLNTEAVPGSAPQPAPPRPAAPVAARGHGEHLHDERPSRAPTPASLLGDRPFAGRIALVTGSGHGIGRAIAVRLAELGSTVVVNSFHSRERGERTAEEIRAAGGDALHVWGSVAKPESLQEVFQEIGDRFGRLDFLVSNASNGMIAPLEHITVDHWDRAFRTNVVAFHQASLLAARLMRPRGGKIVTLSSPGAHRYVPYFGCMGPVKAALESLTRYLAIELGPDNIQVNAISAGPIYGELLNKFPEAERLIPYWESLAVGKRLAEESDLAHFVMFLLSDEAHWITGSVLLADSGGTQRI